MTEETKYPDELRERTVAMVFELRGRLASHVIRCGASAIPAEECARRSSRVAASTSADSRVGDERGRRDRPANPAR